MVIELKCDQSAQNLTERHQDDVSQWITVTSNKPIYLTNIRIYPLFDGVLLKQMQ